MSIETNTCPEKHTLTNYLLGKLEQPELGATEQHISKCGLCEDTLRGLGADDTLSELTGDFFRRENQVSGEDKQLLTDLMTQLKSSDDSIQFNLRQLHNRAAEVARLLSPANGEEFTGSLDQYDIIELIGAGSTGVVYKAVDRQLERVVALKILRPSLGDAARQRFLVEARAAAAISHPNVVSIHHVGTANDLAYIVMQWIPGVTLEEKLNEVTFIDESNVRRIASQIASGLAAAHAKYLIHRDIKPANIWIEEEAGNVIILDFGLARIADDDPQMTATGILAGTPNFMSPEQARGLELDGRSDLFSLGCLMYRASTGRLPFSSNGVLATLQAIQNDTPRQPCDLNPALSADFSDLIMCLLEKQAGNRPSNAEELVTALKTPGQNWPFKAASCKTAPVTPAAVSKRTRLSEFLIAGAIIAFFIAAAAWMYQDDIVRIATNQGELVIQCDDEDVEVTISRNGETIRIVDLKTEQSIDIVAGEYNIEVTQPANGFQLNQDRVVMTRGNKQIVSITRVAHITGNGEALDAFAGHHEDTNPSPNAAVPPRFEFPDTPENQSARSAMLDARVALAQGDVTAARNFLEVANGFNVDFSRLNDSPDEISALIARHEEVVELARKQSPAYNREAIELLVIQANGVLKYDDMRTAQLLRTAAGQFPLSSYEEKVLELQEQIERYKGLYTNRHPLLLSTQQQLETLIGWRSDLEAQDSPLDPAATTEEDSGELTIDDIPTLDLSNLYTASTAEVERLAGEATTNVARLKRIQLQYQFQDFFGVIPQYIEQAQAQLTIVEDELARRYALENQATYEGRTFDDWLERLKSEKSIRAQIQICTALGTLADGDLYLENVLIESLLPKIREHGSLIRRGLPERESDDIGYTTDHLNEGFILAFRKISQTGLKRFILEELNSGTQQSKEFLLHIVTTDTATGLHADDVEKSERHREFISGNLEMFMPALLDSYPADVTDPGYEKQTYVNDLLLYTFLSSCIEEVTKRWYPPFFETPADFRELHPDVVELLVQRFEHGEPGVRFATARYLKSMAPDTDGLAECLAEVFIDSGADLNDRVTSYVSLVQMDNEYIAPAVDALLTFAQESELDGELAERITESCPIILDEQTSSYIDTSTGLRYDGEIPDEMNFSLPSKWRLALLFASFGSSADKAEAWLTALEPESDFEQAIRTYALERIRGEHGGNK